MDQSTQQNAALVEEGAAAADSLRVQAQRLVELVSAFRLEALGSTAQLLPTSASGGSTGGYRGGLNVQAPSARLIPAGSVRPLSAGPASARPSLPVRPAAAWTAASAAPMAAAAAVPAHAGEGDWAQF